MVGWWRRHIDDQFYYGVCGAWDVRAGDGRERW